MLYSVEKKDDLERSNTLASLKNQIKDLGLQDILRKEFFHEDVKKI